MIDLRCYACGSPLVIAYGDTVLRQKTPMPWLVCERCERAFRIHEVDKAVHNAALPVPVGDETWRLVEREVEHYPDNWRLVFKRGGEIREVSVPEAVWRAFDS